MEDIELPMKRGSMNDIDLGEPSSSQPDSQDDESMDVDEGSSSQVLTDLSLHFEFVPHWWVRGGVVSSCEAG